MSPLTTDRALELATNYAHRLRTSSETPPDTRREAEEVAAVLDGLRAERQAAQAEPVDQLAAARQALAMLREAGTTGNPDRIVAFAQARALVAIAEGLAAGSILDLILVQMQSLSEQLGYRGS